MTAYQLSLDSRWLAESPGLQSLWNQVVFLLLIGKICVNCLADSWVGMCLVAKFRGHPSTWGLAHLLKNEKRIDVRIYQISQRRQHEDSVPGKTS